MMLREPSQPEIIEQVDPVGMFDLGEDQTLSPIPKSPKNLEFQESFYSVAAERNEALT
jgi:hypothetical protein